MDRKSYGTQHIESKMNNLLKPLFKADKEKFLIINNIVKNWEKIVGKKYAKLCEAKSINFSRSKNSKAKLTIAVYNSAVGFFLQNNSEMLLERIAGLYGYRAVDKVIIKQEAKEVEVKKKKEIILPKEQEEELQKSLSGIKDEELAQTIAKLGRIILNKEEN